MHKPFPNLLLIPIIPLIIFPLFSYINPNPNTPKQLSYSHFLHKFHKPHLKTLQIQPQQNLYFLTPKTKNHQHYSSTILYNNQKHLQQITTQPPTQKPL
ncbi:ATP-dependent metallopeptidase FtsH/Yme1/Tma family protein, partial [Staphylococcus hominis]|uniref:ATP-dependent metallopeptidase FtsH/Yme1/Tma family protein n=1 Tax=Staphylococcus hominis TaxID=1290 RepID=UPI0037093CDD